MWRHIKRAMRTSAEMIPLVSPAVSRLRHQRKYRLERSLIYGNQFNESAHTSVLHFSISKSATQYVMMLLNRCSVLNNLSHVNFSGYAYNTDFPYLYDLSAEKMSEYSHLFRPTGYLYSVFGGFVEGIPDMDQYRVVLMVRDPRDVVVSHYFSIAHSHRPPMRSGDKYARFMEHKKMANDLGLDGYVLSRSAWLASFYRKYMNNLIPAVREVHLMRYEEMVGDFPAWLSNLLKFCDLTVDNTFFNELCQNHANIQPVTEDPSKHLRKGQPGDYLEKLKPDTIKALDDEFDDILKAFNYSPYSSL